ncbi:hypothetical protein B0T14DRAFT_147698 [Immersiella caudata]|uniref:Uncharacterized protein n=1 Tax=Immersiella caudata TaxID=314043 RepID=A0AA40C2E3_9PEZI|nr:hypothetical protein B0T14DRAFT_147698 [Immersiella caudata]
MAVTPSALLLLLSQPEPTNLGRGRTQASISGNFDARRNARLSVRLIQCLEDFLDCCSLRSEDPDRQTCSLKTNSVRVKTATSMDAGGSCQRVAGNPVQCVAGSAKI